MLCGNRALLSEHSVPLAALERLPDLRKEAKTELCVAKGGTLLGVLAVADVLREDACDAVAALKKDGKELWILTGDHEATARAIVGRMVEANSWALLYISGNSFSRNARK